MGRREIKFGIDDPLRSGQIRPIATRRKGNKAHHIQMGQLDIGKMNKTKLVATRKNVNQVDLVCPDAGIPQKNFPKATCFRKVFLFDGGRWRWPQ